MPAAAIAPRAVVRLAKTGVDNRVSIEKEMLDAAKATCNQLGLSGLICVGGDGSLSIAHRLAEAGVPVIGVPKTIDNDVAGTITTFGFSLPSFFTPAIAASSEAGSML